MTTTDPSATDARQRRRTLQERHRLQVAALDAYEKAVEQAASAQAALSRSVFEAVEAFGGMDVAAGLLGITVKEARAHVAVHETSVSQQPEQADTGEVLAIPAQVQSPGRTA